MTTHELPMRRPLEDVQQESRTNARRQAGCGNPAAMERRTFIKLTGIAAAALSAARETPPAIAGPFSPDDLIDHCVPADKKLKAEWLRALTERGQAAVYRGQDLETIGMPVGGIGAGQMYLTGDGRLAQWDIFNLKSTDYFYPDKPVAPARPVAQSVVVRIEQGGKAAERVLDHEHFPTVTFRGEYPVGRVQYDDPGFPVAVTLEAFSPFIPLNPDDSTLPATVLQYTLKNISDRPLRGTIAGTLQNAVCHASGGSLVGDLVNTKVVTDTATTLVCAARASDRPVEDRGRVVLADFEGDNYGDWQAQGDAFGTAPAAGTLPHQNPVDGFEGKGLVNTYLQGDQPHGTLTSPPFTINRHFISFLVGGGNHGAKTCINLLVDGRVVRTATGKAEEHLAWRNWDVRDLEGRSAQIEIVDAESGPWGHINVDQIELSDCGRTTFTGPLDKQPDFGTMCISVIGPPAEAVASCALPTTMPRSLWNADSLASAGDGTAPLGSLLEGAVGRSFELASGAATTVRFVIAWHFPNRAESGHYYASRFADAPAVAHYVAQHIDRLCDDTQLWVKSYYDATLPYWLLDRLHSTVSTLATSTCEIWQNGRFWAYEGVRCCHGTCGHVWNYEHALARLFPQLERTVREMQDFNPEVGMVAETGMIRFRGNWPDFWCGDAQTGYILKAYREHQTSPDAGFLTRNWPQIRKALEFLFHQDGNDDGVIEGEQHNTYDINFYGPNPMIGILYLGALRAGEELAREMGAADLADRCHAVYESGRNFCTQKLFNGEYYIQLVDLQAHPKHQYGTGCLSDQLFGQGWAHQLALDYILPPPDVKRALESIWTYNWAPDIAPQNEEHPPQRWFAFPGEAGLFTCTWPKSKHLGPESVLYRDEIWTGIEYQVAGHMAWEGMLTEALAICRAVHERYHPAKRNPWNEIECGDHYARGMASWGVLTGLAGFQYHGPRQQIGFAPRLDPQAFRSVFTAAAAWGNIDQRRTADVQTDRIEVQWGELPVATVGLELPAGRSAQGCRVTVGQQEVEATVNQTGSRVVIALADPCRIARGEALEIQVQM